MKQHLLRKLTVLCVVAMAVVMVSNSGGPSGDNTGSPNDSGQNACAQSGCHSSFGLNSGTGAVTSTAPSSYYPGASYSITVQVTQPSPSAVRYGFQGVFLNGSNAQAGTLTAGTGTGINTAGIDNIRHNSVFNSTGSFTFTWNAPTTAQPVTFYYSGNAANGNGSTSGDYVYTNSDAITALSVISFTRDSTDASCSNICDGEVGVLAVTGGAGSPYTYLWSNGDTTPVSSSLCAGTYTVTVTDNDGNTETTQITVDSSPPIVTSMAANPATCAFGDGNAVVSPSGGVGPYTFLWSDGQTMDQALALASGLYTVTVTDASGCTAVDSAFIQSGSSGLQGFIQTQSENCDLGNGSANLTMFSGNQPFTFLWNNGNGSSFNNNLPSGSYSVTVTDSIGCVEVFTTSIDEELAVINEPATQITDALCFGANNGAITVSMESGVSPYSFAWEGRPNDSTNTISSLTAGTYSVTVTDSAGCTDSATFTIIQPTEIIVGVNMGNPPGPVECVGDAEATVSGGVPPYSYLWNDPNAQTTAEATGLCDGLWAIVIVTDSLGCSRASDSVEIFFPGGFADLNASGMKVYPNPASDVLTIESTESSIKKLTVTDVQGRVVLTQDLNDGTHSKQLDVSALSAGSYYLRIEAQSSSATLQILID